MPIPTPILFSDDERTVVFNALAAYQEVVEEGLTEADAEGLDELLGGIETKLKNLDGVTVITDDERTVVFNALDTYQEVVEEGLADGGEQLEAVLVSIERKVKALNGAGLES